MSPAQRKVDTTGAARAWYTVGVLTLLSVVAFIDRQVLSLLVQPIRRDLNLSDTQMSLVLGFAFALFFTVFAIPLGRLADHRSRRGVLALGLGGWSVCTAASGLARTFKQMMLLRMGVGMGEATMNPCAYAIIADTFPTERRSTALGVFSMGMYVGSGIAFMTGGLLIRFAAGRDEWQLPLIGAAHPWQLILIVAGCTGALAMALLFTIPEPERKDRPVVSWKTAGAFLRANRGLLLRHHLGFALITVASSAGGAWIPEMFRRTFHWTIPRFGAWFGLEVALFGSLGVVAAGRIADRILRRGAKDGNFRVAVWSALLALPVNALVFLAPNGNAAMLWLAAGAAVMAAPYGVAAAALQQMTPPALRSQASALYLLILNLVGATSGPTLTALLTQYLFQRDDAVNYSLLLVHAVALTAGAIVLQRGRAAFLRHSDQLD
jgi:MFS family permease